MTHYTKTKGAFITFLVVLCLLLLCLGGNAQRQPKDTPHFHRCQSIKNGIRCNKECLEGEKYCFDDIQLESI